MKRLSILAVASLAVMAALWAGTGVSAAATGSVPATVVPPGTLLASLSDPGGRLGDSFGNAVAVDGNTAVVAGYATGPGVVYIYEKGKAGWPTSPNVTLVGPAGADLFGNAVAINGNTIVVGAYGTTVGTNFSEGAAYIYVKTKSGWPTTPTASLYDPAATTGDTFGSAVAVAPTTDSRTNVIVGASGTYPSPGAAYIYVRRLGQRWPTQPTTTLADPAATAGDYFGGAVAISADTAVVGALNGNAAYVYARKHLGGWPTKPATTLTDPAASSGDQFGNAVALDGHTLVVGADFTNGAQGAAYVYTRGKSGWPSTPTVSLADPLSSTNDEFGVSVAVDGPALVVGSDEANATGAAYSYHQGKKGWPTSPTTTINDPGPSSSYPGDRFGSAVGLASNSVVVGAFFTYGSYYGSIGAAYIFTP